MGRRYAGGLISATPPVLAKDAYYAQNVLHLKDDGASSFYNNTDFSSNNFAITVNGNPAPTASSPFVSSTVGSLYFDGNDDLSIPNSSAFHVGTGDFTIEGWVYLSNPTGRNYIFGSGVDTATHFVLGVEVATTLNMWASGNGSSWDLVTSDTSEGKGTTAVTANTWHHFAMVRQSGTFKSYLDGALECTVSGKTGSVYATSSVFRIGRTGYTTPFYATGNISNIRFVKGRAVYTGAFTPSTVPLTTTTGGTNPPQGTETSLLTCMGEYLSQNNKFLDSSSNNFSITRNGNATQGSFSPFSKEDGKWGVYFDGSGDYLQSPSNSAFAFGTGAFTVEMWVCPTLYSGVNQVFWESRTNEVADGFAFYQNNGKYAIFTTSQLAISTDTLPVGQWVHVALVGNGGADGARTITLYVNGSSSAGFTVSNNYNFTNNACRLGAYHSITTYAHTGYLSNVRVLKGTALYTSNFTPSTTPLTAITNTSLLCCQSNRFKDNSSNAFTLTPNGNVAVTPFSPFANSAAYSASVNGGSGYFDGDGDYVAYTGSSTDFNFDADFTWESWVYPLSFPSNKCVIAAGGLDLGVNSSGTPYLYNGGFLTGPSANLTLNNWQHLAVARSGTTMYWFINGAAAGSFTNSTNHNGRSDCYIGSGPVDTATRINAYLADVRIVKGRAVYTSSFTPSTTPLGSTSGGTSPPQGTETSLLLNFTNAGIYDQTGTCDLETVGNAQISTAVKKYGTGSLAFDGSGDYIDTLATNPALAMGSGDFTWEFWLYMNSLPATYQGVIDTGPTGGRPNGGMIYFDSTTLHYFSNSANIVSKTSFPATTWTHVAVVRSGTTVKMYIDGVQSGSSGTSSTNMTDQIRHIGRTFDVYVLNGYIDDLRISRYARYTGNFTPPSAAFPNR